MIVPFRAEHLGMLELQNPQSSAAKEFSDPEYGKTLESTYAYSLLDGDKVLCCAGIVDIWRDRAFAWALVGKDAGRRFFEIHKNVSAALRMYPARRVEMAVDVDFDQGHRWARLLGMTAEGTMKAYQPDGRDCVLYARIKG